ncbi:MAG: FAD-linked oxidase C-terminal domain-containing protein [Verrucomicrobiota bacterium JB022]|nr:FAD-linked oxidase C-terminal domain-containing protein [Verrucomicrobiota bacterium JB022]
MAQPPAASPEALVNRPPVDLVRLSNRLKQKLQGEVRLGPGASALYATDSSNYRLPPLGVVIPKTVDDVVHTLEVAREMGVAITSRGGGTGLAGQTANHGLILDFSKYLHRVTEVNVEERWARVEPGCVLDTLQHQVKPHGLRFGPDPSTHNNCSFGGMIGNNACGTHSVLAAFEGEGARTSDQVIELEVLTYDGLRLTVGRTPEPELDAKIRAGGRSGEIYGGLKRIRDQYGGLIRERFPDIPRRVSGYNLDDLLPGHGCHVARALCGTEGTCVVVLSAKVRLLPEPKEKAMLVLGFPDIATAADHVPLVMEHRPMACEGMDQRLLGDMEVNDLHTEDIQYLPDGHGWLIVEFGGDTRDEAKQKASALEQALQKQKTPPSTALFDDPEQQKRVWEGRESGLGATAHIPHQDDTWEGWEDTAVPPEKLGDYLRDFRKLFQKYDYDGPFYGHFGQGLVHTRINFLLKDEQGIGKFRRFLEEGADLVVSYGGTLSGEHGDGQSKAELLEKMYGPELIQAFAEFKALWDPDNGMNPHKVVDPYPLDSKLRLGAGYRPREPKTHFKFPQDDGSFAQATLRCVGVGNCRKTENGTMCPSYMVTREEQHATRGRAHLLFELLQGDVIGQNGWKDDTVHEALSLCLACKACKSECPVNVDMATYKAEFMSHYYEGRLRPRPAYAMGYIYWWARLASKLPGLANFMTQAPGISTLAKKTAGLATERQMPRFARQTFRAWFEKEHREPTDAASRPVALLWPDTFNNFLLPHTAQAMVKVLEHVGYRVVLPPQTLCCGRPLYDYGLLDRAKKLLFQTMEVLRPQLEDDSVIVGIEPSCLTVFRDELQNLFPHHEDARRLGKRVFTLAEFLQKMVPDAALPQIRRKALVHRHCHHQSILKFHHDQKLLERLGLDFEVLDSGCCGMAGSFGFEADNYAVSVAAGERVLLPRVRAAKPDTLIIADGFSCREQILQLTDREPKHVAEVIAEAL